MGGLISGLLQPLFALFMNLFERPMVWAQQRLGQRRIAWVFLAPNLIIFGLFTFLPIILNFYYATTGGVQILPQDRVYVGSENFQELLTCDNYLDPNSCNKDLFWRAIFNTALFVTLQVGFMIFFSLITALVLNAEIRGRGFFPQRVFLSSSSITCRRGLDLEVDPAA